jgi:hypothetical protein
MGPIKERWARRCEYGEHASPPALLAQLGRPANKSAGRFFFSGERKLIHRRARRECAGVKAL